MGRRGRGCGCGRCRLEEGEVVQVDRLPAGRGGRQHHAQLRRAGIAGRGHGPGVEAPEGGVAAGQTRGRVRTRQ